MPFVGSHLMSINSSAWPCTRTTRGGDMTVTKQRTLICLYEPIRAQSALAESDQGRANAVIWLLFLQLVLNAADSMCISVWFVNFSTGGEKHKCTCQRDGKASWKTDGEVQPWHAAGWISMQGTGRLLSSLRDWAALIHTSSASSLDIIVGRPRAPAAQSWPRAHPWCNKSSWTRRQKPTTWSSPYAYAKNSESYQEWRERERARGRWQLYDAVLANTAAWKGANRFLVFDFLCHVN